MKKIPSARSTAGSERYRLPWSCVGNWGRKRKICAFDTRGSSVYTGGCSTWWGRRGAEIRDGSREFRSKSRRSSTGKCRPEEMDAMLDHLEVPECRSDVRRPASSRCWRRRSGRNSAVLQIRRAEPGAAAPAWLSARRPRRSVLVAAVHPAPRGHAAAGRPLADLMETEAIAYVPPAARAEAAPDTCPRADHGWVRRGLRNGLPPARLERLEGDHPDDEDRCPTPAAAYLEGRHSIAAIYLQGGRDGRAALA